MPAYDETTLLILDQSHQCLVFRRNDGKFEIPKISISVSGRPLQEIHRWFREFFALDLGEPCGQFLHRCQMHFTFVIAPEIRKSMQTLSSSLVQWIRLSELATHLDSATSELVWLQYEKTMLGGYTPPARQFDVFSFGNTPVMAARLAHMVARGHKRATAFWVTETARDLEQFFPFVGCISLVTDGYGYPLCFIKTTKTEIVAFKDVPHEFSVREGEGDCTFDDWRDGHQMYFANESRQFGIPFTENSKVFLEEFELIKTL